MVVGSSDGQILNIVYYTLVLLIGLSVFGFDVMYLVITIAGLLVSFAFMIGSASAKYIEVRLFSTGSSCCSQYSPTFLLTFWFASFRLFRVSFSFWFENLMILETKSAFWTQMFQLMILILQVAVGW